MGGVTFEELPTSCSWRTGSVRMFILGNRRFVGGTRSFCHRDCTWLQNFGKTVAMGVHLLLANSILNQLDTSSNGIYAL